MLKNYFKGVILISDHFEIFMCPGCKGKLVFFDKHVKCEDCNHYFPIENGIPLLFWPPEENKFVDSITYKVKKFYEETPFPNYEGFETIADLIDKAKTGKFANSLSECIPFNIRVLEVGCGTGQLSNFLGIHQRFVFGTDMSFNSLKLGQSFKIRNSLKRVQFYQMNLFNPIFKDESFPIVISNGVLHHTKDPYEGFQRIAKLVKPGGYILIGLYNKFGRIFNDARRYIFSIVGNRFKVLDSRLKSKELGAARELAWYKDQYKNPHESKHTIDEILQWFADSNFTFVSGLPSLKPFDFKNRYLFESVNKGSKLDHLLVQIKLLFQKNNEGGFFIMIGRKRKTLMK